MGKSVFLVAAVITTAIFISVFFFVRMQESAMLDSTSKEIMSLFEEQQANKILQNYLGQMDENSCIIFERQISRQLNRIYALFYQLEKIKEKTFATSSDLVKRQYLLASMSLWIDLENASKTCKLNILPILYFFLDQKDCILCDAMVAQLEALKADCPNARVFAFPSESEDFEFVELLKKDYNVSSAPAIVAGSNVAYEILPNETIKGWIGCR
jgi:hypothetical protein